MKKFFTSTKARAIAAMTLVFSFLMSVAAYADVVVPFDAGGVDAAGIMTDAIGAMTGQILPIIGIAAAAAMGILGLVVSIRFGIRFVLNLLGRA
ncbi:MAG: hypothetical protein FWB96_13515 [Defluviitaleaceae bacterium]|nr:hypothetical protein [Defluviitaleaceae bacterium]MCL2264339.1 hypothetical protein [Defluviitaleaceae bacterium]